MEDRVFINGDIVEFKGKHKWAGCIGTVEDVQERNGEARYLVGVHIPEKGIAYIGVNHSEDALKFIGNPYIT